MFPQGQPPPPPPTAGSENLTYHHHGPQPMWPGSGPPVVHVYTTSAGARGKGVRVLQACDSCRLLRVKCDEEKPCKNCREKNIDCRHRDAPPKQPDKSMGDISVAMARLLEQFKERLDRVVEATYQITQAIKPAMPVQMTLASLPLTWPSILARVQHQLQMEGIDYPSEYPIRQEEQQVRSPLFNGVSGQSPSTSIDLEEGTVWKYVEGYLQNIQNMHPLIIPKELYSMVQTFLNTISTSSHEPRAAAPVAKFITQQSSNAPIANPLTQPQKTKTLYRDIDTALILTVLALGKISLHPQEKDLDHPGREYFAIATDIIGNHIGAITLKHVWVNILASVYFGQISRPIQSLERVALAWRTLQYLIRPHRDKYDELATFQNRRGNQYVYAFWTCLQLESDILADLPLPPSGVLAYEHQMPYPNPSLAEEDGFPEDVLLSYQAQVYLRKLLNGIRGTLYDACFAELPLSAEKAEVLAQQLQGNWMPDMFSFQESDPPASGILAARLRVKYWDAIVIIFRPFIRMILESNHKRMKGDSRNDWFNDSKVINHAKRGIQALIESTRAFHGLGNGRFIVTNVFGTAHTQWGNLLVLDAVRRDPTLSVYLDENLLKGLFNKTIDFIEEVVQPSSSLKHDLKILEGLYDRQRQEWR